MKVVLRSSFNCSPEELFDFYMRPGTFERMIAPWNQVKILSKERDIFTVKVRILGLWFRWVRKREVLSPKSSFVERQLSGPFALWKHTHRFHPKEGGCLLEDEVEFKLFGGIFENWARKKIERVLSYRHETLKADFERIKEYQSPPLRILVSGSSGLVGRQLVSFLKMAGHEVISLVRSRSSTGLKTLYWDPTAGEVDRDAFEGFDAVIHLAGKNIASGLWSEKFKKELFLSRCRDTWLLSQTLLRLKSPPEIFMVASAVGIYGNRGDEELSEKSSTGKGFLADLCVKWEAATGGLEAGSTRVVHTRFGLVLSSGGGLLARIIPTVRWGLGAILGSGKQYLSWVALDDLIYGLYHALMEKSLRGAVNVTAPTPYTFEDFLKTLGKHLNRSIWLKVPAPLLSTLGGEMAREMVLTSQRVFPEKLKNEGFVFSYPTLDLALDHFLPTFSRSSS